MRVDRHIINTHKPDTNPLLFLITNPKHLVRMQTKRHINLLISILNLANHSFRVISINQLRPVINTDRIQTNSFLHTEQQEFLSLKLNGDHP